MLALIHSLWQTAAELGWGAGAGWMVCVAVLPLLRRLVCVHDLHLMQAYGATSVRAQVARGPKRLGYSHIIVTTAVHCPSSVD